MVLISCKHLREGFYFIFKIASVWPFCQKSFFRDSLLLCTTSHLTSPSLFGVFGLSGTFFVPLSTGNGDSVKSHIHICVVGGLSKKGVGEWSWRLDQNCIIKLCVEDIHLGRNQNKIWCMYNFEKQHTNSDWKNGCIKRHSTENFLKGHTKHYKLQRCSQSFLVYTYLFLMCMPNIYIITGWWKKGWLLWGTECPWTVPFVSGRAICGVCPLPIPVNLIPNGNPSTSHHHHLHNHSAANAQHHSQDHMVQKHLLPHWPPSAGLHCSTAPMPQPARHADCLAGSILRWHSGGNICISMQCLLCLGIQLVKQNVPMLTQTLPWKICLNHLCENKHDHMAPPTCFLHCNASPGFFTTTQR